MAEDSTSMAGMGLPTSFSFSGRSSGSASHGKENQNKKERSGGDAGLKSNAGFQRGGAPGRGGGRGRGRGGGDGGHGRGRGMGKGRGRGRGGGGGGGGSGGPRGIGPGNLRYVQERDLELATEPAAYYNQRMTDDPWAGLEAKTASRAWADFKGKGKATATNDELQQDDSAGRSSQHGQGLGSDVDEQEGAEGQDGQNESTVADAAAAGPVDTDTDMAVDSGGPALEGWTRRKAYLGQAELAAQTPPTVPAPNEERLDGDDDDDIL